MASSVESGSIPRVGKNERGIWTTRESVTSPSWSLGMGGVSDAGPRAGYLDVME